MPLYLLLLLLFFLLFCSRLCQRKCKCFLFLSNQEQTSLYMNWYEEDYWGLAVVWGQWKCVCVCVSLFRHRHGMLQEMNWKSWWSPKSSMGILQFGSWVQWFLRRVSKSHGTWVSYCEFVVILSSLLLLRCFRCSRSLSLVHHVGRFAYVSCERRTRPVFEANNFFMNKAALD